MTENQEINSNVQTPQSNPQPQPRPITNNTSNSIPNQYKPLSPWAYIGYNILFAIPILGFIMMLVFAFDSSNNLNRRNYSRSVLYARIIVVVLLLIIVGIALLGGLAIASGSSTSSLFESMY